jgi:hypothetical protein
VRASRASEPDAIASWSRVGRVAGFVSGFALLLGTILYLLDATNALGSNDFKSAGPPSARNEARFWVSEFAHQHHILWDIFFRDTLFPVAFVALIVLSLAVRAVIRSERPNAQLMVAFFFVGGILATLNDLIYLGATDYWRLTGWSRVPTVGMVAAGRSEQAIVALTTWPEAAGFVVLAAALVCLGNLCRSEAALPAGLALVAYLEAALLVGVALAEIMQTGTPNDVLSLITGAVVGPFVAVWLGWHLGSAGHTRSAPTPATTVSS